MASMTLTGFDNLEKKLRKLASKVSQDIVRKATKEAAKVILKPVKSNAKTMIGGNMGGLIAKNAVVRVFKFQRKGSYGVWIGMKPNIPQFDYWPVGSSSNRRTRKTTGKKSYIPAALEYGHGNARPIPYIRRAFDSSKARATTVLGQKLKEGIERAAAI